MAGIGIAPEGGGEGHGPSQGGLGLTQQLGERHGVPPQAGRESAVARALGLAAGEEGVVHRRPAVGHQHGGRARGWGWGWGSTRAARGAEELGRPLGRATEGLGRPPLWRPPAFMIGEGTRHCH